jgi:hypothetical protein
MKIYYWKCCGEKNTATSVLEAKHALEAHEKDKHGGKKVGSFGWSKQ